MFHHSNNDGFLYLRHIRRTSVGENLLEENEILSQLKTFLYTLSSALSSSTGDHRSVATMADGVMMKVFGFTLERQTSMLPGLSGRGVFLKDGKVPAKHIVALYPGTYMYSVVLCCIVGLLSHRLHVISIISMVTINCG